jgi:hypothetical protein
MDCAGSALVGGLVESKEDEARPRLKPSLLELLSKDGDAGRPYPAKPHNTHAHES